MRIGKKHLHYEFITFAIFVNSVGAEFISLTIGAGALSALGAFLGNIGGVREAAKCKIFECCGHDWIKQQISDNLQTEVNERLYGQHIANKVTINAIRAHMSKNKPSKALVMSFHGWTGSGKNYLAKMIAEAIYKKGMKSDYAHLFVATHHFPHFDQAEKYKDQLRSWINGNLTICERSLFVFDEMDKMPIQLLDAIVPYIDFHERIDGVDPRKSVFLFLSNSGSSAIAQRALEQYNQGLPREGISYRDMEELVQISAYNEGEGGLKTSRVIDKHLVDYFVPFLPMERSHVELCFKDYLKSLRLSYTQEHLKRLVDSLAYFPKETPIFSLSGCKQVVAKTDFMLNELIRESHRLSRQHSDEV